MRSWTEAPKGECILRRNYEQGTLHVEHADPRILITEELVADWRAGKDLYPEVALDGDLIRIRAANRTVIYRLVEHVPEWRAWVAEWPD